jgi:hypothetical protein
MRWARRVAIQRGIEETLTALNTTSVQIERQ